MFSNHKSSAKSVCFQITYAKFTCDGPLASRTMPPLIDDPKTGKQKLRNTVISFLKEKRCFWHSGEVENSGESFSKSTGRYILVN